MFQQDRSVMMANRSFRGGGRFWFNECFFSARSRRLEPGGWVVKMVIVSGCRIGLASTSEAGPRKEGSTRYVVLTG